MCPDSADALEAVRAMTRRLFALGFGLIALIASAPASGIPIRAPEAAVRHRDSSYLFVVFFAAQGPITNSPTPRATQDR